MTEPIRVLLAEDHHIVRGGLRALLAHHDNIDQSTHPPAGCHPHGSYDATENRDRGNHRDQTT